MIVCVCHRVTESQIASHALTGGSSFEELKDELLVATACEACHDCARSTFDAACCDRDSACARVREDMRALACGSHAGATAWA